MRRADLIALLAEFVGPVGPLGSLDEKFQTRDERIADADFDDVDLLLDILVNPPDLPPVYAENGKWDSAVVDSLITWGRRDPTRLLVKIGALLTNKAISPAIIKVIGGLRHGEGLHRLTPLVDGAAGLTEDDRIALAGALGEIGGAAASELLDRLDRTPGLSDNVRNEVNIARRAAHRPPDQRAWYYGTLRETYEQLKGRVW